LAALGFARAEIDAANSFCCGAMTWERAPHLKPKHQALRLHQPVRPRRRVIRRPPHPHDGDGAALYLGAISKTINMPNAVTLEDCKDAYMLSLALGPEGDGRLSRRLQVVANRWPQASSATTRRPRSGRPSSSRNRRRSVSRWSRRKAKRNAVQALRLGDCPAPDAQLRHPETFR